MTASLEPPTLPRANILLVDDQPNNLLALEAILEPLGQNLVMVGSGAEALKKLLQMDFAAILLDVQMPEMDGFETAMLVKQRAKSRHIPILFLTAISKDDPYVFKGYSVGAVDYIFKPFNPDVLRSKVSVFIELHRKNEKIKHQAELLRLKKERDLQDLKRTSEQRYRDLAESMPQLVFTADSNGVLTYRNRRFYDCAGIPYESKAPLDWEAVLHPDDVEGFRTQWDAAVDAGAAWEAEFRFGNRAVGAYRWHLVRALPISREVAREGAKDGAKEGARPTWIGTSTDIDDRKQAERALRLVVEASTALSSWIEYEAALDHVARAAVPVLGDWCAIVVNDVSGDPRRIEAGPIASEGEAGVAARDVILRALDATAAAGNRRLVPAPANLPEEPGATSEALLDAMARLGFHSLICVPIVARERVMGAMAFMRHERGRGYVATDVRLAEDLARRVASAVENAHLYAIAHRERAQLEAANRAKDEFLAVLSHELRTPLNSMLGWTQIVRGGGLDEKMLARAMETIERNAKTQAQLIADLLDVSRIVTGKLATDLVPVGLVTVVEQAVEAARPAAAAAEVGLVTDYVLGDEEVNADPDRLQQVVGNILSNAIKFTPQGGGVRVRVDRDDRGDARVAIEDDGKGIDPAFLPHVFERFRQAEGATTRAHGGLGLGLAIVRHLVDAHGGSVKAESEGIGRGARFTVTLPVVGPQRGSVVGAEHSDSGVAPLADDMLLGLVVLIVEDDDDGRELLEMVLSDYGAKVTAVGSAAAAIEALGAGAFDILVTDIGLPHEDGYSLLKRVRALPPERGGKIPAIALTAYASLDDRARALAAGFEAHVTKPVEPQTLAAAVSTLTPPLLERRARANASAEAAHLADVGT